MRTRFILMVLLMCAPLALPGAAPSFWNQPQDQTVDSGTYAQFDAGVFGPSADGNVYYQWYRDGTPVPWGAGSRAPDVNYSATLFVTNVMSSDAGGYYVVLTNRSGAVTSRVATLTVRMRAPVINGDPTGSFVCEGQGLYLYGSAVGSHPMYYQWQLNGTNLPGGFLRMADCLPYNFACTEASWWISSARQADSGDYRVIFTNQFGASTTAVARLTVNSLAPVIDVQPMDASVLVGEAVALWVSVSQCPTHFQWRHDGIDVPGNISSQVYLSYPGTNDSGNYVVVVSNSHGAVTSAVARLTVNTQSPQIVQSPASQSVYAGNWVLLSVVVRAGPPAALQWRFNNQNIPGATGLTLYFQVTSTNQAGAYSVFASNSLGSVTSDAATLTVLEVPPRFDIEPVSQGVVAGSTVILTASATGNPAPTYQWRLNGEPLVGVTNNYLQFVRVPTNLAGDYTLVAANEAGSVTSRVATLYVFPPGPLDRWQWRNPLPQGNDLKAVAYGNGTFVGAGDRGTKVSSSDGGVSWRDRGDEDDGWLGGVAYGNGVFVKVGYFYFNSSYGSGYFARVGTSPDGVVWTERSIPAPKDVLLYDVAFGNGRFVAVGNLFSLVSSNGIDWVVHPLTVGVMRLTYGNGMFVGITPYDLMISTNGESWSHRSLGVPGFNNDITFGMGRFVISTTTYNGSTGYEAIAMSSTDLVTWSSSHIANDLLDSITYADGKFVTVGGRRGGLAAVSTDAANWEVSSVPGTDALYAVAFGAGRFAAVGNFGNIATSPDGTNWTAPSAASELNLRSVTRGKGISVAVGNEGLLFTSANNVTWTRQPAPTTNNIRGVTFGNDLFVAVGEEGADGALLMTSSNGVAWTRLHSGTLNGLYAVTFADGTYVAVGDAGTILASSDGVNWARVHSTGDRLNAVTYGAGMFVAVGRNGLVLVSGNGTTWTPRSRDIAPYLQAVAYGNNRFVAGFRNGGVFLSTNGVQWTIVQTALNQDIEDLQFANGMFIAVGEDGLVASSTDGIVWTPHRSRDNKSLRSVMYADGRFIVVGNNEAILQSGFSGPPILRVRPFTDEGFEFSVEGEAGRSYRLQGSTDLRDWLDLLSFSNNDETTLFLDTEAEDFGQRFYRVVSP